MTENSNVTKGIGQQAVGMYKVLVVDADTEAVVYESDWSKNLILNQGMDQVASKTWVELFEYGVCGTGTSPNSIDSSTDTISQSGTTITAVGGTIDFTTDAVAGDMIKWDSGEEARITSVTSALIVEATPSQSVGSDQFTIWKTARVGLQTETKRSNTYLTGAGNCETTQSGTTLQHRRTYDFSTEVGSITYTEVGVAWASTLATTVFSRILLNTPVPLISGQKLRLVYQLNITFSPSVIVTKNLPVGGWPVAPSVNTDGQECIQRLVASAVSAVGSTASLNNYGVALDPASPNSVSAGRHFAVSTNSSPLAAFGSAADRSTTAFNCSVAATNAAYTPLSFQLDVSCVFQVADAVSASIRSVCLGVRQSSNGWQVYDTLRQAFTFLFDQAQTKTNTQTLTFTVRFTWTRVLA
ncbi:MAG: hypothetical protein ACOYB3_00885 [Azonexus sp.]